MKKTILLFTVLCVSQLYGMGEEKKPRPEIYQLIDPFIKKEERYVKLPQPNYYNATFGKRPVMRVDWLSIFGVLDKMGGLISVDEYRTQDGYSLLWLAVKSKAEAALKILLEKYHAKPDTILNDQTPLMLVCSDSELPNLMAQLLIKAGANVNYIDKKGMTPLWLSLKNREKTTIALLIDKGANVNQVKDGKTPLKYALDERELEIAQLLIDKGANVNQVDDRGNTLLILAADGDNAKVVQLLINGQANIDQPNKQGWTPLIAAAYKGNYDIVKLLLNYNANINLALTADSTVDPLIKKGDTALDVAEKKGHTKIVELLKKLMK